MQLQAANVSVVFWLTEWAPSLPEVSAELWAVRADSGQSAADGAPEPPLLPARTRCGAHEASALL